MSSSYSLKRKIRLNDKIVGQLTLNRLKEKLNSPVEPVILHETEDKVVETAINEIISFGFVLSSDPDSRIIKLSDGYKNSKGHHYYARFQVSKIRDTDFPVITRDGVPRLEFGTLNTKRRVDSTHFVPEWYLEKNRNNYWQIKLITVPDGFREFIPRGGREILRENIDNYKTEIREWWNEIKPFEIRLSLDKKRAIEDDEFMRSLFKEII